MHPVVTGARSQQILRNKRGFQCLGSAKLALLMLPTHVRESLTSSLQIGQTCNTHDCMGQARAVTPRGVAQALATCPSPWIPLRIGWRSWLFAWLCAVSTHFLVLQPLRNAVGVVEVAARQRRHLLTLQVLLAAHRAPTEEWKSWCKQQTTCSCALRELLSTLVLVHVRAKCNMHIPECLLAFGQAVVSPLSHSFIQKVP